MKKTAGKIRIIFAAVILSVAVLSAGPGSISAQASSVVKTHAASGYSGGTVPADAAAVYEAAEIKNAALDSCAATFTGQAEIFLTGTSSSGSENSSYTISGDMKAKNAGTENLAYILNENISSDSWHMNTGIFYENAAQYVSMDLYSGDVSEPVLSKKFKKTSGGSYVLPVLADSADPGSAGISAVTDMQMEKAGDSTILRYHANPEKLGILGASLGNSLTNEISISGGTSVSSETVKVTSFGAEVTIGPDGYYTDKKIHMTMTIGDLMTEKADIDIKIENPGVPVDFEMPSAEGYEEYDPASMNQTAANQ